MTYYANSPFVPGLRLIDGSTLNAAITADIVSSEDNLTAGAGGGLANAYQLRAIINKFSTVATAQDSAKLPPALAGASCSIDNDGAAILAVFPAGTDTLEDAATSILVLPGQDTTFVCPTPGKWYQLGGVPAVDTITAHAGGTQAAATPLVGVINRVSVCATNADSVRLPASGSGSQVIVINDGAATCQVFGAGTDTIDGVATATGVAIGTGKRAIFWCLTTGAWYSGGMSKTT